MSRHRVFWLLVSSFVAACGASSAPADRDAAPADVAVPDGTIADARPDALELDGGAHVSEAGPDVARDSSVDARSTVDGTADASLDAGVDAHPDATPDAAADAAPDAALERACFDDRDDDGDGRIDCADPDCRQAVVCFDVREDCGDGADNTGDDHVDCADVTCADDPRCPAPDVPAFSDDALQALLLERCTPCHVGGGSDGALRLDPPFRDAVVDVLSSQVPAPRVKPGDRDGSYLFQKVAYTFRDFPGGGGEGMPPLTPLSRTELERLGRWIDAL